MKKITYILFVVLLSSCQKDSQTDDTKAVQEGLLTVEVGRATYQSTTTPIVASGVLASKSEMKLAFKTGGMIKRIYVQEGQSVKSGQLLAELDLSEISAQAQQSRIGLTKAKRDLDRVKRMYADEAVTLSTVQDATSAYEAAQQTVRVASFNQKLSKIYAPSSGKILRKAAEQGELITPFAPAFILGTGDAAYTVSIGLSDKDLVKVKIGDAATVFLDAYPNEPFQAKVSQIAQTVNPATGTFEVELNIQNNSNRKLISGFVARAEIVPTASQTTNLTIPIEAVVEANGENAYLFTFGTKNIVSKTPIRVGKIVGNRVEILEGITEETSLVVRGANFLSDGQKVKLGGQ